jgi:hypothetical protein
MQREAHSRSDGQRGTILEHSWRSESRTRESLSRPKKAEASQNLNEQIQAGQRTLLDHSGGDLLEVLCQMGIKHLSDLEHFWLLLYLQSVMRATNQPIFLCPRHGSRLTLYSLSESHMYLARSKHERAISLGLMLTKAL